MFWKIIITGLLLLHLKISRVSVRKFLDVTCIKKVLAVPLRNKFLYLISQDLK